MLSHPFTLLDQFSDRLHIALFTKEDGDIDFAKAAADIGATDFATLNQIHGNRTIHVTRPFDRTEEADGMLTDRPGIALIVRAADCQMFAIVAPEQGVIGTLHVGWRGLVSGAIPNFFRKMQSLWDIKTSEVYVFAGPSLCADCAEFSHPSEELPTIDQKFIHGNHVDLRRAADEELFKSGIQKKNFQRHPDCTRCHPEKYWTWRGGDRDAVTKGHTNILACSLKKKDE